MKSSFRDFCFVFAGIAIGILVTLSVMSSRDIKSPVDLLPSRIYFVDTLKAQLSEASFQHTFALAVRKRLAQLPSSPSLPALQAAIKDAEEYLNINSMAAVIHSSSKGYQILVRPYSLEDSSEDFYLLQNDSMYCLRPISATHYVRKY